MKALSLGLLKGIILYIRGIFDWTPLEPFIVLIEGISSLHEAIIRGKWCPLEKAHCSIVIILILGTIDEVDQQVNMTWVQPRVLDYTQVMISLQCVGVILLPRLPLLKIVSVSGVLK